MTVRLQPPPHGGGPLYAEKWTIKCSSIQIGVFPFALYTLLEGVSVNCSLFTQIVAQCTNWELPWRTAVTAWHRKPDCSSSRLEGVHSRTVEKQYRWQEYRFRHRLHWKGFSPACFLSWIFKYSREDNVFGQNLHLKYASPVCFLLWCTKLELLPYFRPHVASVIVHLHFNVVKYPGCCEIWIIIINKTINYRNQSEVHRHIYMLEFLVTCALGRLKVATFMLKSIFQQLLEAPCSLWHRIDIYFKQQQLS